MSSILRSTGFLLLLNCSVSLLAQNEFSKWYFGFGAGLDFATIPPTVLTNGMLNSDGAASISNNIGNLLFYTDGAGIINSNHVVMANGNGLSGNNGATQAGIIVKQPGNPNIYYVFTLDVAAQFAGAQYSIVDMSLAAGLGSVTVKNATLYTPSCEKQVAVRHCNGKDVWIVSHEYNTNNFRAYLLTSAGLSPTAVISAVGETIAGAGATIGQLKISRDGKKLACATASSSVPSSLGLGGFFLFDFDAASGIVSNSLTLNNVTRAYGLEFSPDGTKLYGIRTLVTATTPYTMYQWNICAGSNTAIVASQYTVNLGSTNGAGAIQWAIDGKLYITRSAAQFLDVINSPNSAGSAMGYTAAGLSLAPKMSSNGLPNYINAYTKPIPMAFNNTVNCQSVNFSAPPTATFGSGCSNTPYPPGGYLWDFGDVGSGAANSSTLTNVNHIYTAVGTYTASLILFNSCTNDTLKQIITITTAGPNPAVAGPTVICKGEKATYTASGGSAYLWSSNNATTSSVTFTPTGTTSYTLSATTNGCTLAKTFTVAVDPCTRISSAGFDSAQPDVRLFPNPVNDELIVETITAGSLFIFDMNGKLVLETKLAVGENKINTGNLKAGFYTLRTTNTNGSWRGKLVKVE